MDNLDKEADSLPIGLDNLILKESLRARRKGIEDFILVPHVIIEDLTTSIDALQQLIDEAESGEQQEGE